MKNKTYKFEERCGKCKYAIFDQTELIAAKLTNSTINFKCNKHDYENKKSPFSNWKWQENFNDCKEFTPKTE